MVEQQEPGSTDSGFSARLIAADDTRYELSDEQTLGRSQDADITISDPKISRKHARFQITGQQLTVEDLGSANGTRVNQRSIEGTTVLCDGDVVSFDTVDLSVALTGVVDDGDDGDATIVASDDATIVGSYVDSVPDSTPETAPAAPPVEDKVTEPEPVVSKPAEQEPQPADSVQAEASSVSPRPIWVDEPSGEFTRVLSMEDAAAEAGAALNMESASDLPHLIITTESGSREILELAPAGGDKEDVWEIGRDQSCKIVVPDDSVSSTHAQLIHKDGRWRLVNLVSTNGIYVNGKKRLKVYLADGDKIKLGMASLVFKSGSGAAVSSPSRGSGQSADGTSGELGTGLLLLGFGAIVVAGGLWWFLS